MQESDMKNSGSQTGGHLNQEDQDHMELLENILSIPSWSEIGVKNNWELAIDTSKLTKSELAGLLSEKQQQAKGTQENVGDPQIGDMVDDAYLFAQLQQQRTMLSADTGISQGTSLDMVNVQHQQEHLVGMNHGMLSGIPRPPEQPLLSPSWRQPFIGGVPIGNPEIFNYGQREFRGEDLGREAAPGVMFNVYPHLPQPRAPAPPVNTNTQRPPAQVPSTQPQPVNPAAGGAPRPRVRARRGQATDPHSIAERLRRERIAERMKALQDLVPNANKTDKASMLDEIVDYVKFLQLQVKVLSMSRLGGAGAVPSLVADLPAEGANSLLASTLSRSTGISHDGLASAERQVARLMDEDMGSAMQYLQSKGLCLMPISLATASGKVPLSALQTIGSNDNKQYTEASVTVSTDRSSSVNVSNNNNKLKESPKDAKSPKTATKSSDESSRNRSQ